VSFKDTLHIFFTSDKLRIAMSNFSKYSSIYSVLSRRISFVFLALLVSLCKIQLHVNFCCISSFTFFLIFSLLVFSKFSWFSTNVG